MSRLDKHEARSILNDCLIYREEDGHWPDADTLHSTTVDALLEVAKERGYRKPKNANGSRGRYWYEYLRRTAG